MFLVCGEALFDFFLDGEEGPAVQRYTARAGGSPFNVAVGLARLEVPVGLLAGISTDLLGVRLARVLADEGVSDRYLVRSGRPTTISLVGLDAEGVPAYQFLDAGSAGREVRAREIPPVGEEITGLHMGSYSLVVPPVADALGAIAARSGLFLSLDPNIRLNVEPDIAIWRERLAGLYPHADMVKISAEDLELLHPGMAAEAFARGLHDQGAALVVVTDGGARARGWTRSGVLAEAVPPQIEVVDTVGAGDTFQAALIAQILEAGPDPRAALAGLDAGRLARVLDHAARAAAITCTRRGADLPRRRDLEA